MSDTPSTDAPRVPLPAGRPGPLAPTAGPDPVSWPAPSIMGLPPLALGGMGGGALRSPSLAPKSTTRECGFAMGITLP